MLAITTFPQSAWSSYAKTCVERMVQLWPGPVRVYFEGSAPPALDGAELRPLDSPERTEFITRDLPNRPGFLWNAKRFCHKVFAQLDAMKERPFWWIDGDVAIFRKVRRELIQLTDVVTYLGRDSYTETGLVGFKTSHEDFPEFQDRYRRLYTEYQIFTLPFWTDCHAFDAARQGLGENLTPGGKGFENVMEVSKFGAYIAHFKGPRKAYVNRLGGANEVSANLRLDRRA